MKTSKTTTRKYRVVRYADGSGFGLHEIIYTGNKPARLGKPVTFLGDSAEFVLDDIQSARLEASRASVVNEEEIG